MPLSMIPIRIPSPAFPCACHTCCGIPRKGTLVELAGKWITRGVTDFTPGRERMISTRDGSTKTAIPLKTRWVRYWTRAPISGAVISSSTLACARTSSAAREAEAPRAAVRPAAPAFSQLSTTLSPSSSTIHWRGSVRGSSPRRTAQGRRKEETRRCRSFPPIRNGAPGAHPSRGHSIAALSTSTRSFVLETADIVRLASGGGPGSREDPGPAPVGIETGASLVSSRSEYVLLHE